MPWYDISMNFIMAFLGRPKGKDAIIVAVDRFSMMPHFIACHKSGDANYIVESFI